MYPVQLFALFFTVATRIFSTKQMMVYDQITFFIKCSIFLRMQKTWENIAKSAEKANLPRIPRVYVEGRAA